MGGRGSRRALFSRYFRLGGSLALPVRLFRCPIADLNLGVAGNHYRLINELLFGCPDSYTPCFKLASMNLSRSPSSTAWVLPISTPVRRSLIRDWSNT
uniref:Uncharacterized protein n=1 Tax=Candidatus Kentrum sp. DK TaxID=2126562 RepID=A0A450S9D4_9GAMM|nr:MAG: hypothetical protein BECKDK2373C_GA0170839_102223 [Candidatus Kentron sp. DK]